MRCKVMYRCVCARHRAVEADTQQGYEQTVLKKQTWDPTLPSISRHCCTTTKSATTPRQQSNLRLTHLQCSQFTWSRNQGRVTSSHVTESVTFAEREYEIPNPDRGRLYTGIVTPVLRDSVAPCHHQQVCSNIVDTIVRTSRFTFLKILLACNSSHQRS